MFKVGDLVVCTDNFEGRKGLTAKDIAYLITVKKITAFIDDWGLELNDGEHWVDTYRFRHATPEEIAAGHRNDKTPLMQHLDKCEEVVKTWPEWKQQSIRDAFGLPNLETLRDCDTSPNCKKFDEQVK